ncbi:MAG: hypothetical protein AB7I30_03365, partial [Isosphaeraceae bacterium]
MTRLGELPGNAIPEQPYKANDVSFDGSVVVGYFSSVGEGGRIQSTPFRWTEATGTLDPLESPTNSGAIAEVVSGDGSTIFGLG